MARIEPGEARYTCDLCMKDCTARRLHVEYDGVALTFADAPDGWDLCSLECLEIWVPKRREALRRMADTSRDARR